MALPDQAWVTIAFPPAFPVTNEVATNATSSQ